MRACIIDDEQLAVGEIRRLLSPYPDIDIVGDATSVQSGLELVTRQKPDLMFLDIQMPDGTGFDLFDRLPKHYDDRRPAVIFTTAFGEYAARAFEVHAMDYLLKPVEPRRLDDALQYIRKVLKSHPSKQARSKYLKQFFIRDGERCWMVRPEDIRLVESEGNYSRLLFGDERPLILRSLQEIQAQLEPSMFFRANRHQLVNMSWILRMRIISDGILEATLRDGSLICFSRRQSFLFRQDASL